ncbi:MAG: prolipoprotein diacylglyceryl transferase [Aestuariivita sp.]|nr:prolipoprotein diacylglyceryl transferase [Aestuariivita sp.]
MLFAIPFPNLSPELFAISVGDIRFAIRWYALSYIAGILVGWQLAKYVVKQPLLWPNRQQAMAPTQVDDLITWLIIGIIAGGRLGFVLFYQPAYYIQNPLEIFAIWQGGMSFHGGLLGVIIAAWVYAQKQKLQPRHVADLIALCAPVGLLLGRIANFINAELWGRPTSLPWGVIFPSDAAQNCPGIAPPCARHPSQLYEALLEGLVLWAVLIWLVWWRRTLHRPGLVVGVFFTGYGIARFAVEFVRQPDVQFITVDNPLGLAFHLGGYGLTMGQVLSLPMIVLGLWLMTAPHAKP